MPPPTPNIGQLIGASNTGYAANVPGKHSPVELTNHSGNLITSSHGQVIEGKNISGVILLRHDNVRIINCKMYGIWQDGAKRWKPRLEWCVIGPEKGMDDPYEWNGAAVWLGDFLIYRCEIRGVIDLIHPSNHGKLQLVESWLHSTYANPNSRHYAFDNGKAHQDPIQPRPTSFGDRHSLVAWDSFLIQGCRFDTWPIKPGQTVGSTFGQTTHTFGATSGAFNFEFWGCRNTTFRDNYVDGHYHQGIYVINGDNNTNTGKSTGTPQQPPSGTVIIDNIFKGRRNGAGECKYGITSLANFGGHFSPHPTVVWGRNYDADTGAAIPSKPANCGGGTGTRIDPGPSSQYPSFYTDNPDPVDPNPVVALEITSPADESTHTTGSVTFVGQANTGEGDSDANYNYFNYYIASVDNTTLAKTHLDRDQASNNTGATLTATSEGVTFTRRGGSAPESHPVGDYKLIIEGERKDGTRPSAEIVVTFGEIEDTPIPTNIQFEPVIPIIVGGSIKVNTVTGGVPRELVQSVRRRVPATWKEETYLRRKDTKTEVIDLGDLIVDKDSL